MRSEPCWLRDGCPSRSGVCSTCEPDGDDCPIWRWFKDKLIVKCKDCIWGSHKDKEQVKCVDGKWRDKDWFCANASRKEDIS